MAEIGGSVDEVENSIIERDRKDSARADSPLVEAHGAVIVDTSDMGVDEVVDHIIGLLS